MTAILSREVTPESAWNPMREETAWIGRPWRRIELLTQRHFYKGEQVEVHRSLTLHVGQRRGGFSATLMFCRGHYDYSEERP